MKLTPADAPELLRRVLWFVQQERFDVPEVEGARRHMRGWAVLDDTKSHLAAGAAALVGLSGDTTLLPELLQLLELVDARELDHKDAHDAIGDALERLLALGATVTPEVLALARHEQLQIRLGLAYGLSADAKSFEALYRALAQDPQSLVRQIARDALATFAEVAWWSGVFTADPALHLGDPAYSEAIIRFAALAQQPTHSPKDKAELMRLLDALPDALALDVIPRMVRTHIGETNAHLARMGRAEQGLAALIQLVTKERDLYISEAGVRSFVEAVPEARREATARAAFELAMKLPVDIDLDDSRQRTLVKVGEAMWPASADPGDLVERAFALTAPAPLVHPAAFAIAKAAARAPDFFPRWRDSAIASLLSGDKTDAWRGVWPLRDAVLKALPLDTLRAVTARAMASPLDDVAIWGLKQRVGGAYDASLDPSPEALVAELCADPRLRELSARTKEVVAHNLPLFQGFLRCHQLTLEAAAGLLLCCAAPGEVLRTFWSGVDDLEPPRIPEADWAAWRSLRDRTPMNPEQLRTALLVLPVRVFEGEDRAFLDRAIAAYHAGELSLRLPIGLALRNGGTEADLPLMQTLIAHDDSLEDFLDAMKARLGLSQPRRRAAPKADKKASASKAWMDSDD